MKQLSEKQFDRMCRTLAEKYYKQTNESRRKCFFWAVSELSKEYIIENDEDRKEEIQKDLLFS